MVYYCKIATLTFGKIKIPKTKPKMNLQLTNEDGKSCFDGFAELEDLIEEAVTKFNSVHPNNKTAQAIAQAWKENKEIHICFDNATMFPEPEPNQDKCVEQESEENQ